MSHTSTEYLKNVLKIESPDALVKLSGAEMANLWVQSAYRRSRGNGKRMVALLREVLAFVPRSGGGFGVPDDACHPDVPGCSGYMAKWYNDFVDAIERHIALIRQ